MIRVVNLGDNSEKTVQLQELQGLDLKNVWIELVAPSEDELQAAAKAAKLPASFLRISKADHTVSFRTDQDFGIIRFLIMQDAVSSKKANRIVLAFSKTMLVTVEEAEIEPIIKSAKERMAKTKVEPPSQVVYFILDEVVANHYLHIEKLESLTAKIEEEVVEKTSSDTLKRIFKLKSNMIRFNKVLWYERGLVFDLRKCSEDCMASKVRGLFDSTHEELTRQVDIVETYREILSDAINVHLSAISNKINLSIQGLTVVIFYLTIITTLTSFPNTVATFFGISQFGNTNIAIISVAILLSILLPFVWLWRKKWLKLKSIE